MLVEQNFKWHETEVPLVVFLPNYNGARLTKESLKHISTVSEPQDYLIIVGNDGVKDDFSEFAPNRIRQITLYRSDNSPRNGAFIRNYVIKRCRSEKFFQKDGEVCIEGDFIFNTIHSSKGIRAGNIAVLNKGQTEKFIEKGSLAGLNIAWKKIEPVYPQEDLNEIKKYLVSLDGQANFISYFHYAYGTRTKLLQALNGYDERFTSYGWEDVDMYLRLAKSREMIVPDPNLYAIHLYHQSTVNREQLPNMKAIFASNDYSASNVRNLSDWGNG